MFYRNFLEPYYLNQNSNSRWDLLDVVRACFALRPDGINWPIIDGVVSLKLEHLTKANNIEHNAHDALADVKATIAIAKLIKTAQPRLFNHLFKNRNKFCVQNILNLNKFKPLVHISGMFGNKRANCAIICPIMFDPKKNNEFLCCDLASDVRSIIENPAEELRQKWFAKQIQGENFILPIKGVKLNRCPVVVELKNLNDAELKRLQIDKDLIFRNLELLQSNQKLICDKLQEIYNTEIPKTTKTNAEATLYQGFPLEQDKPLIKKIKNLTAQEIVKNELKFSDARFNKLLVNYKGKHFYELLTGEEKRQWINYCKEKLNLEKTVFDEQISNLKNEFACDLQKLEFIKEIENYAKELFLELQNKESALN